MKIDSFLRILIGSDLGMQRSFSCNRYSRFPVILIVVLSKGHVLCPLRFYFLVGAYTWRHHSASGGPTLCHNFMFLPCNTLGQHLLVLFQLLVSAVSPKNWCMLFCKRNKKTKWNTFLLATGGASPGNANTESSFVEFKVNSGCVLQGLSMKLLCSLFDVPGRPLLWDK